MTGDGVDRILEQWARERPELDTEAMGIFGRIYRIARASGDAMEATYGRFGITRADFDVLATLRRSGEPFALTPSALTGALMLTSGGITGRVDRLERAGLVARSPSPTDRRALLVTLTPAGREVVDKAVVAGLETQRSLLAALPPARRRELDGLLRDLLAAAG
ncbi:MarR family winged helix-turn-helix transcriptional regulator [Georgenia muralis]|uniref:DNA-binding MarR family transcriptional regulator n=1 Tax=Georgenia muralis TaxID=154117 RepID=A0A3N4ZZZ6_9MICO|nr:MarR family transcriptional regulator [Georgenia muralis]RPF26655.1 DNA-binding MarR family transcriptional regulator [Georgenia muralis]